jgi:hypothetical protein
LVACADPAERFARATEADSPPGEQLPANFIEQPLGAQGQRVQSLESVDLPFVPVVPDGLKDPVTVATLIPPDAPLGAMVAWTFDDPSIGTFGVLEYPDDMTTESLKREVASTPQRGCFTSPSTAPEGPTFQVRTCTNYTASLATLDSGQTAQLIDADTSSSVTWVEPLKTTGDSLNATSLVIEVIGPIPGFSPDQALAAADLVTAG